MEIAILAYSILQLLWINYCSLGNSP